MKALHPCSPECQHSEAEHDAFDLGLQAGESGDEYPNPYTVDILRLAWDSGRSVGEMNRQAASKAIPQKLGPYRPGDWDISTIPQAASIPKRKKTPSFAVLNMPVEDILQYEVARAVWPQFLPWPWLQALAGNLIARRAMRIRARFDYVLAMKAAFDKKHP